MLLMYSRRFGQINIYNINMKWALLQATREKTIQTSFLCRNHSWYHNTRTSLQESYHGTRRKQSTYRSWLHFVTHFIILSYTGIEYTTSEDRNWSNSYIHMEIPYHGGGSWCPFAIIKSNISKYHTLKMHMVYMAICAYILKLSF